MDKDKFEEGLDKVIGELEPSDVESVANWPVVKALMVLTLAAAAIGITAILAEPYLPAWLSGTALVLEATFGIAGMLFLHFRWLGRSRAGHKS